MIIIPFEQLQTETLDAVIEEFVSREGTEYGVREVALETKVAQVKKQLENGSVCLCYDQASDTCNILPADEARSLAEAEGHDDAGDA